jgi:hypothetical protein
MSIGLVDDGRLPDEGGEFAGDRDGGQVVGLAPLEHEIAGAAVHALLGAPGGLDDAGVLAVLAAREGGADGGAVAVVVAGSR